MWCCGVLDDVARWVEDLGGEDEICVLSALVDEVRCDGDCSASWADRGCAHTDSPLCDVNGIGDAKPGVAIDAGAGVPTAVGLERIVNADSDVVRPAWR